MEGMHSPSIYLYGHTSFSAEEKKNIISSTIKYIRETRRFENWISWPSPPLPSLPVEVFLQVDRPF